MGTTASSSFPVSVAKPRLRRLRLVVVLAILAAATAGGTPRAEGGSGSQSDPWINEHIRWARANVFEIAGGHVQEMRPTIAPPIGTFWASNVFFSRFDGFYYGLQTEGELQGSQPGANTKVAVFSVFARWGPGTYRVLNYTRCTPEADGGYGISCSIPYNWTLGVSFKFTLTISLSANPAECPAGYSTACLVYSANVRPTDSPTFVSEIARWSLAPNVYGDLDYTDHFLEHFGGGTCGTPSGRFKYPLYVFSANPDTYAPGLYSQGDSGNVFECGRSHLETLSLGVIRLVNI